jgi:hypothetical protein
MSVKNLPQVDDGKGELVALTPSKIDLRNGHAIRREIANVYRDMRNGGIEPADGTKLAYVLDMLRKSYETAVLEDRLNQIEAKLKSRN